MLAQMGQVVDEKDLAEIIRKVRDSRGRLFPSFIHPPTPAIDRQVDLNGDGKLDYGEFVRMMRAGGGR